MISDQTLENYQKDKFLRGMAQVRIARSMAKDWNELCPLDPAKKTISQLTFRRNIICGKEHIWAQEFPSVIKRTAIDLLRELSNVINNYPNLMHIYDKPQISR